MFGPGTLSGIKVITITDGASRRFEYYPRARTDGLQTREEVLILEGNQIHGFKFLSIYGSESSDEESGELRV